MLYKSIVVFVVLFGLFGCKSHTVIESGSDLFVNSDGKATVILSVTRGGSFDVPFYLFYRRVGSAAWLQVDKIALLGDDDWHHHHDDNSSKRENSYSGRLVMFTIDAGEYEFYSLNIEDGYAQGRWGSGGDYRIPFSAKEGQINYAGNIHIDYINLNNSVFIIQSTSSLHNEAKRDLAIFDKKFPSAGRDNIVISHYLNNEILSKDIARMHLGVEERQLD